ncbi:MAG TPA: neutral zinc metallopeptidase [Steroidobacteraceae bacterium]|nr:neutral zinc metallopeptidase [Steroidobacteraceae bacterium]
MRWQGRRQSENIEDRRGMRVRRGVVGGGIGTIALVLLAMYFGIDPSVVMQGVGTTQVDQPGGGPYAESATEAEWREQVAVVLADTEQAWGAAFREMRGEYREPTLVLFSGAVESACGFAEAVMGPFYCSADERVFIDLSFFGELDARLGAGGDFARAYVIAHEVGHHVQNLLGASGRVQELRRRVGEVEGNQLSVRLELQADCYAGFWARHAEAAGVLEPGDVEEALNAASAIGDDTLQRNAGRAIVPDSFTHGSAEQRARWFKRGFAAGSTAACDTFAAADV